MPDPTESPGPLRLTPTVVELVVLLTVGGAAVLMVIGLFVTLEDGWSARSWLGLPVVAVLGWCTVVIWRRTPHARVAASVGLLTVVALVWAISLSDGPSFDVSMVIPLVPLVMLWVDRRAFPEDGLRRRRATERRFH
jgi:hypothetical protein